MMTKFTHVSPESSEWISGNLRTLVMDRKLSSSSVRMEKLARLVSSPRLTYSNSNDTDEFEEEDVWGDGFRTSENGKDDADILKAFSIHRRWLAVDRDSSLSRGLSALSPLNCGSGNLFAHVSSRDCTAARLSTVSRMIPQIGHTTDYARRKSGQLPQSAPVKVPDWSQIVGIAQQSKDGDFYDDGERLPPHEFPAREHARNRMITFSVYEGVGRTLKGRDLSRVRNAVWRQTGLLK